MKCKYCGITHHNRNGIGTRVIDTCFKCEWIVDTLRNLISAMNDNPHLKLNRVVTIKELTIEVKNENKTQKVKEVLPAI